MKNLVCCLLLLLCTLSAGCGGPAEEPEATASPLSSSAGQLNCVSEYQHPKYHQLFEFSDFFAIKMVKLNPWPTGDSYAYEVTLECPMFPLDPTTHCSAWQVTCNMYAHQPHTPWVITGTLTVYAGQMCFSAPTPYYPNGTTFNVEWGIPSAHPGEIYGLCAYSDDRLFSTMAR